MDDGLLGSWGYKSLKILLVFVVLAGLIFLIFLFFKNRPPDIEGHRRELDLLEKAYRLRRDRLQKVTEKKVAEAPNEVIAIKYQQDLSDRLDRAEELYFQDRRSILEGCQEVLQEHWAAEISQLGHMEKDDGEEREQKENSDNRR